MFRVEKTFTFDASHTLPNHDGKCARLHGHTWSLTVVLEGDELRRGGPQDGMLVDFGRVSAAVKPLVAELLDHHHLNDTVHANPTSENLARALFDLIRDRLRGEHGDDAAAALAEVRVRETPTSVAAYRRNA